MAMSARHLSCTSDFDTFVSDHYYQACLETLIPSLNDLGVTMDDDLLAATVILRLREEYDGEQSQRPPGSRHPCTLFSLKGRVVDDDQFHWRGRIFEVIPLEPKLSCKARCRRRPHPPAYDRLSTGVAFAKKSTMR